MKSEEKTRKLTPVKATKLFMDTRYVALPEGVRRAINPKEFRQLKNGGTVAVATEVAQAHPIHLMEDVKNGNG